MLHGNRRTCRSWDAVVKNIRSRFHVIALDARGHGDSDWPEKGYRLRDGVEDLIGFCVGLGLKDAIGVGHSSGGLVMALAADKRRGLFSRLVLLEPVVVVDEAFGQLVASKSRRSRRTWPSHQELYTFLKRHKMAGRWRDDVIQDVVSHETIELPDGSIAMKWGTNTLAWSQRRKEREDLKPVFRRLGLPIVLVAGEQPAVPLDGVRPIAAEISDFRMVTMKGTGHNMYMERPEAVAWTIGAFVDGHALPPVI